MPKQLFTIKTKNRVTIVGWSNDWYTLVPWQHKGIDQNYISRVKQLNIRGDIEYTYLYIGPFGIVSGKLIN